METINSPLNIIIDADLSINDVVRLQDEGFSVLRSAHVGNLSPYNLTLAASGIPLLSVDHTITGVDKNYFPEAVQTQGAQTQIAPLSSLVCRARTEDGQFVDEFHLGRTGQILPGAHLFTNTEYLKANESIVQEVVDIGLCELPNMFKRIATEQGWTRRLHDPELQVRSLGIMQLLDEPRAEVPAVLMPNELDIVANFVIESLTTERAVQYHLSGPDMVKYIARIQPDLAALYAAIQSRATFAAKLPDRLEVRLVPAAEARFATTAARASKLDALLEAFTDAETELELQTAQRSEFFTSAESADSLKRNNFLTAITQRKSAIRQSVAERLAAIPELFVVPGSGVHGFITQYDVEREGGLYVAEINRTRTMAELSAMTLRLTQLTKGLP